ncbi:baseplate J/gp47 family protein [Oceanibacterium hippocampi]|uniref:Baseplate J-like protein n=1 Tax=Oceanibacterium hippocampi TaxID=745714 RepID=A0A1Y5U5I5_9PROT|nr:baseplate J/gp47 family protein [Oceanibacterium hippocampi]SLN77626.1 Baseplate J-like protein [Oceanibacterium hippocampi]
MPFERPSLTGIHEAIVADIASRLPGADPLPRRSELGVLATALAGATHETYGFLAFLARQITPDTADGDYLARWAAVWGIARAPAAFAGGAAALAGIPGTVVPEATEFQSAAGLIYRTEAEVILDAGGIAAAAIVAALAGQAGNLAAGAALDLVSGVDGLASEALVAAGGLTGGADAEADAVLLGRVLDRIQAPPHGGAEHDYRAWALDAGAHGVAVDRVFVAAREQGTGTVTVRFTVAAEVGGPIPDAGQVAAVAAHIEASRPVGNEVFTLAPIAQPLDFQIRITPDTAAVRAAVTAELADLIDRLAAPGATLPVSKIREAVSIAAGEDDNEVVAPAADVAHGPGDLAVMGAITWIEP